MRPDVARRPSSRQTPDSGSDPGSSAEPSTTWQRVRAGRQSIEPLLVRARAIDGIRRFFKARGFLEVDTPQLVRYPGMEPHLDVFRTELATARGWRDAAYLTTSPEYAMKKLLAAGLERIFQICKSYRNGEEVSALHNPEFTILEWYRANADYRTIMADCEDLLRELVGAPVLRYRGEEIAIGSEWERLSVCEAFARYASVDLERLLEPDAMADAARSMGLHVDATTTWEQLYHQIFLNRIEPNLGRPRPTILYDYPVEMAALARPRSEDPRFAERFELYVAGIELGNAFGELTDPEEQLRRLRAEQDERRMQGKLVYDIDRDFIAALEAGIPPSGGIALGVDRLVMLLADVPKIRDVLWFPAEDIFGLPREDG